MDKRAETGRRGELLAREYILGLGWQLVEANWRCRSGEIDIIARDGKDLVFVEVRTKTTDRFGTGAESVNWRKQKQVRTLAGVFLLGMRNQSDLRIRFDMISIYLRAGQEPLLQHLRNAF